ncbi:MAG TPA: dihydroxyacetone kinase, partial [Mycobacterium sp.]
MSGRPLDASGLLDWAHAAVGGLVVHAEEINRLNVFPVADADTGTNMLFTMRAALAEAERRGSAGDVSRVAAALAGGAL